MKLGGMLAATPAKPAGAVAVVRAIAAAPYVQLTGACDLRDDALEAFRQRFEGSKTYHTVEELCDDPNVEVVWISTPNQFHCAHAIAAAERGKHIVIEKPMALSMDEAERMAARAGLTRDGATHVGDAPDAVARNRARLRHFLARLRSAHRRRRPQNGRCRRSDHTMGEPGRARSRAT